MNWVVYVWVAYVSCIAYVFSEFKSSILHGRVARNGSRGKYNCVKSQLWVSVYGGVPPLHTNLYNTLLLSLCANPALLLKHVYIPLSLYAFPISAL